MCLSCQSLYDNLMCKEKYYYQYIDNNYGATGCELHVIIQDGSFKEELLLKKCKI